MPCVRSALRSTVESINRVWFGSVPITSDIINFNQCVPDLGMDPRTRRSFGSFPVPCLGASYLSIAQDLEPIPKL